MKFAVKAGRAAQAGACQTRTEIPMQQNNIAVHDLMHNQGLTDSKKS